MFDIATKDAADRLLSALGEQLAAAGQRFELIVVGGSGLLALGLIERSTRDVDLLGLRSDNKLESAKPLEFGLPEKFVDRLERRDFGNGLTVYFASRYDQIHFKLYALVDQGPGKHEADLRALSPTEDELLAAARWSRLHDPSPGYERVFREVLAHMGVRDADLGD